MAPEQITKGIGKVWEKMPAYAQIAIVLFSLPLGLYMFRATVMGQGDDVSIVRADMNEIRKNTDTLVSDMQYFKAMAIKADAENAVQNATIADIATKVKINEQAIQSLDRLHRTHETQIDMLLQRGGFGLGPQIDPDQIVGWLLDFGDPL